MNECARPRGRGPAGLLLALLFASLLGGCQRQAESPPLEGASIGGPFALTSHEGRRVTDADFAGRYRIVYFGFSFCPDVCPTDLQAIGAGLRRFEAIDAERAARVQPLFVTVDPARDSPQALAAYVANFHPRLIGLTGTEREIAAAAREHAVYYERGEPDPQGNYTVNHSRTAVLFGPEGEPIVALPTDRGAEAVAAELDRWVR